MGEDWVGVELWVAFMMLLCALLYHQWRRAHRSAMVKVKTERVPKRATPEQCPDCRISRVSPADSAAPSVTIPPWPQCKSRRGRRKQVDTEGYACPNPSCAYFGEMHGSHHALVGDGSTSSLQWIQSFRCQACGTTFSSRLYTPLYRIKTPAPQIATVLTALAEGLTVRAAVRVFGHAQGTIATWLCRAGQHSISLHTRTFQQLHCLYLWTLAI